MAKSFCGLARTLVEQCSGRMGMRIWTEHGLIQDARVGNTDPMVIVVKPDEYFLRQAVSLKDETK